MGLFSSCPVECGRNYPQRIFGIKNDKARLSNGAAERAAEKLRHPGLSKGQKSLQSLEIQPVHLLLRNMLANWNMCFGFSAKFTAIKAVGGDLPSGFWINGAMT